MNFHSYTLQPEAWTEHWGWALPPAQRALYLCHLSLLYHLVRLCASTPGRM